MDPDLASVQDARDALRAAHAAQQLFKTAPQEDVDRVVAAMVEAGAAQAERLGRMAFEETGFGRPESKTQKNLFATRTLAERMAGLKTAGVIEKSADGAVWKVATPMGVVAALVPSTNPTSTAFYKAIIAVKARCAIVMSPHPRAVQCTAEAARVVGDAATAAGAPDGLVQCLTRVSLAGTDALMEHDLTDVILATGGGPMVRAAYSKGKPAYGVGSGNVPAYVDRSANLDKAAADILTGTSFDWGTLCSTERSVVADAPVRGKLLDALRARGGHVCSDDETRKLRAIIKPGGQFNTDLVGQSPCRIAEMAGFSVPEATRALIAEVTAVGPAEPLSMETLSPILSFYAADGWEAGCVRCIEILEFGGIGHTLALHATSERVIEQFALKKPSMRIVVNTVAALGSVGMTTALFPAMTLGPGTLGGSITSDNVTPMHLVNVKRVAFETAPLNSPSGEALAPDAAVGSRPAALRPAPGRPDALRTPLGDGSWMDRIEERLLARAGNRPVGDTTRQTSDASRQPGSPSRQADAVNRPVGEGTPAPLSSAAKPAAPVPGRPMASALPMPVEQIDAIVARFRS